MVMSLARVALFARQRPGVISLPNSREASDFTHINPEMHNGEEYQTKEGFSGAIWRNTFLVSLVAVAAYKYAPDPTEDTYLTRWITLYGSPRALWLELNAKHTAMEQANSEATILLTDAKKPKVHRYRYPQTFDQISPFLTPVGMDVDTSNFIVKGDRD